MKSIRMSKNLKENKLPISLKTIDFGSNNNKKNQIINNIIELENHENLQSEPKLCFLLGTQYLTLKQANEAIKYLNIASELAPNVSEVFNNLSNALLLNKQYIESENAALKCLSLNDQFIEAWITLANVRIKMENVKGAIDALKIALSIKPDMYPALINLGNIYFEINEFIISLDFFEKAKKSQINCYEAYNGIGLVQNKLGNTQEAITSFKKSLTIKPLNVNALSNLAMVHQQTGNSEEALVLFRDALSFDPENIKLLTNFAHTLQSLGRSEEAAATFQKTMSLDKSNLNLLPYLINSEMQICDWKHYKSNMNNLINLANKNLETAIPPFSLANSNASPETRLLVAKKSSIKVKSQIEHYNKTFSFDKINKNLNRKIRVGYVSPDFREHSLGESFLPLIKSHNKSKFEIFGYATKVKMDDISCQIKKYFECFQDISQISSLRASEIIHNDKIDILIDLAGHTKDGALEIFALKPAPVQAHYLGYGSTIGAEFIDWLISDRVHTTDQLMQHCSESLVLLPDSFMSAENIKINKYNFSRKEENLPEKSFVFANFNSHSKFDPESFYHWMKILRKTPNSVLWLRRGADKTEKNLINEAKKLEISEDRLIFAKRENRLKHITRLGLADICLDNFLHNGGVTTIDALIAKVPVVTLAGKNHSERTGASILTAAGLKCCIANNKEEYLNICLKLALEKNNLNNLKSYIRKNISSSKLFNTSLLAQNIEKSFELMFQNWLEGLKPKYIQI